MRVLKYALGAFLIGVSASSNATNPWADDYGKHQRYVVRYVHSDGSVTGHTTTDKVRPDIYCQTPVAKPWEDKSKRDPKVALRIRDRQTGQTRIYRCG